MMEFVLFGNEVTTREALHDRLYDGLELPEWYGRNLDALYDCLTEMSEEVSITVINSEALEENLGAYARLFFRVLEDAAEENLNLHIEL